MSRYRIIDGKRYNVEKRNLLCTANIHNGNIVDLFSKTINLHCMGGKEFILDTMKDLTGECEACIKISRNEAVKFMNAHPDSINYPVYIKWFGEPEGVE